MSKTLTMTTNANVIDAVRSYAPGLSSRPHCRRRFARRQAQHLKNSQWERDRHQENHQENWRGAALTCLPVPSVKGAKNSEVITILATAVLTSTCLRWDVC